MRTETAVLPLRKYRTHVAPDRCSHSAHIVHLCLAEQQTGSTAVCLADQSNSRVYQQNSPADDADKHAQLTNKTQKTFWSPGHNAQADQSLSVCSSVSPVSEQSIEMASKLCCKANNFCSIFSNCSIKKILSSGIDPPGY
jgi:hypothetical protein